MIHYAYDTVKTIILTEQEFINSLRSIGAIAKDAGCKFSIKSIKTNGHVIKWPVAIFQDGNEVTLGAFTDDGKIEIHWKSEYHKMIRDPHWYFSR